MSCSLGEEVGLVGAAVWARRRGEEWARSVVEGSEAEGWAMAGSEAEGWAGAGLKTEGSAAEAPGWAAVGSEAKR